MADFEWMEGIEENGDYGLWFCSNLIRFLFRFMLLLELLLLLLVFYFSMEMHKLGIYNLLWSSKYIIAFKY
jgi:hypothetical protein